MIPATANYKNYLRGDTINARRFTITQTIDDVESPVDLSNSVIRAHFIYKDNEKTFSIGNGITMIDAANGIFEIDSFQIDVVGTWDYDVEIMFPDGTVRTWVRGSISISNDITK